MIEVRCVVEKRYACVLEKRVPRMARQIRCNLGMSFLEYNTDPGLFFKLFLTVVFGLCRDLFLCINCIIQN